MTFVPQTKHCPWQEQPHLYLYLQNTLQRALTQGAATHFTVLTDATLEVFIALTAGRQTKA
jgi:hypothetical protein